jgi:hypothetical protein
MKRISLTIFRVLAQQEANHDALLRSGLLAYILNDNTSSLLTDRKLGRIVSDIIHKIASHAQKSYARNQTFIAQGAVDYIERFIESDDTKPRTNAICFLAWYIDSTVVEHLVFDIKTVRTLIAECIRPDAELGAPLVVLNKVSKCPSND